MHQLSALDSAFLYLEHGNAYMHIGPVMIYAPPPVGAGPGYREVFRLFEQRLSESSIFFRKLALVPGNLDYPYWIDDPDLDLTRHIHRHTLPRPGNKRQFLSLISRLHACPLDRDRPLWEAHVIDGLGKFENLPSGCFAVYLKTHHATSDGATGVEIVNAIHDLTPKASRSRRVTRTVPGDAAPDKLLMWRRAALNGLRRPVKMAGVLGRVLPVAWRQLRNRDTDADESPLIGGSTRFNRGVSAERVVGFIRLDLRQMQLMKRAVPGMTINDVVLTTISGALRRYLLSKNELPDTSLVASVPVNTRQEHQKGAGGNVLSFMRVSMGTDKADPLERLRVVRRASEAGKTTNSTFGGELVVDLADSLPSALLTLTGRALSDFGLLARMPTAMHTCVTNVPGPREPLYLAGAKMQMITGLGPSVDGFGLFHTASSYCEVMALGFQCCADMLPDPAYYEECLRESYEELCAAIDAET